MAERPNPLSIAVCALVALNADPSSALNEIEHDDLWEKRLISFLQDKILHGATSKPAFANDIVPSFLNTLEQTAGQPTAALLQKCLKQISLSVDALVDFFSSLQSAVGDGTIDGASAQGIYVRKTCLGFDKLSFEGTTRLWGALKNQIQEMNVAPALIEEGKPIQAQYTDNDGVHDDLWPLSPPQMEAILRQQCAQLEQSDHSFEETEQEIRRIMACDPELPAAHFLRFLNCWRHGERVGALNAMHQYFDYAMIQARKRATSSEASATGKAHDVVQYAAILLAALHHAFGDESLSLKATEEAVRVSQESRDPACVAYALGWLYCNEMGMDAQDLLRRCSSRAAQGHLRRLVAGANISLARHLLGTDTESAASCWTSLLDATTDPPPSSTTTSLDRPTHMTNVTSSEEAMELLSRQILVGAGIWQAFGLNGLSGLSSLVSIHSYSNHLSPQELACAVCNLARISLYGRLPQTFGLEEDSPISSMTDSTSSLPIKSSTLCRYAAALRMLMRLHETQKQTDTTYRVVLVLHEWAVRRGDLEHAEFLSNALHSYLHPRMPNYKAARVDTMLQHVLLLSRQGHWEKAKLLAKKLCDTCQTEGRDLRVQHATLLIQLALIQLESRPQNFIGALPPLMECINLCDKCAMDSQHATALSILAQVHLRMQDTKQAIAVLKATLPCLVQDAHIWFVGEAYLTLAKCHLQQAKKDRGSNKKLTRSLELAVDCLSKSANSFRECDDATRLREVYHLLARCYNSIPGKTAERNDSSKRFVKVSRHLTEALHSWKRGSFSDMAHLEQLASRPSVDA